LNLHRPLEIPGCSTTRATAPAHARHGEGQEVARVSANKTTIELCGSPVAVVPMASFGWLLSSLLAVVSCNSLLGIGEASLQCDTGPCTTDVSSAGGSPAGRTDVASLDSSAAGGGAGGANPAVNAPPDTSTPASSEVMNDLPLSAGSSGASGSSSGERSAPPGAPGAAASDPAADGGTPVDPAAPASLCSSGGDACGSCLCDACAAEVASCTATPGCFEIVACARLNGCVGFACFCGSVDLIACATIGGANGPCVDATLGAPGSHLPSLASPSAGPASEAALAIANCSGQRCPACLN
jgi:hypothetical protein